MNNRGNFQAYLAKWRGLCYNFREVMTLKDKFLEIYRNNIVRSGSDRLLEWILKSDFFTAPASTKFHGAYEGGLVEHSVNVYNRLLGEVMSVPDLEFSDETIAISALLHDICKVNTYKIEYRNRKNPQTGQWEQYPSYSVEDTVPYGHGEKSVYIINSFMRLTRDEAMAINWHMGGFDDRARGGSFSISKAFEMHPLAVLLHVADLKATYLDEHRD